MSTVINRMTPSAIAVTWVACIPVAATAVEGEVEYGRESGREEREGGWREWEGGREERGGNGERHGS